jgi:hypothetical protein
MAKSTEELETDVARLICLIARDEAQSTVMLNGDGTSEAGLQQLRDALNKLIDERVAAAIQRFARVHG